MGHDTTQIMSKIGKVTFLFLRDVVHDSSVLEEVYQILVNYYLMYFLISFHNQKFSFPCERSPTFCCRLPHELALTGS